jgi:hypothetical protein
MTYQHRELAAGRWSQLSFVEQMAHVGGELERALNWRSRQPEVAARAGERALELLELTLAGATNLARRRELARLKEAVADYFFGDNRYASTEASWRRYFWSFAYAARRGR